MRGQFEGLGVVFVCWRGLFGFVLGVCFFIKNLVSFAVSSKSRHISL